MWGVKTFAAAILVGLILFGGSALLVQGEEKTRVYSLESNQKLDLEPIQESINESYKDPKGPNQGPEQEIAKAYTQGENKSKGESMAKTREDFPSPIQGNLLRKTGESYSEELDIMLFHPGNDYAQAEGAVIRVKHPGTVIYAGPDPLLGNKVEVNCGENWSVIYGGLKNLRVKEGDWLEVDEAIGQIGYYPDLFGDLEQTHLHYEVWQGDLVQIP